MPSVYLATSLPHDADCASGDARSPVSPPSRLPLLWWPDSIRLQSTGLRTRRSDSSQLRSSNDVPVLCRGRARCRPVRPFECLFLRSCYRFRRLFAAYLALDRDVAISPRLLGTRSGQLLGGLVSLSADRDPLALLRFHLDSVYQNGATHNPAMTTPFRPSRGSFQTGRCPTASRLAPNSALRVSSLFSVPHVAPLNSPIGRWDRRCRVCSDRYERGSGHQRVGCASLRAPFFLLRIRGPPSDTSTQVCGRLMYMRRNQSRLSIGLLR